MSPHELPKAVDKDPRWRAGAVFTRGELELLLTDERLLVATSWSTGRLLEKSTKAEQPREVPVRTQMFAMSMT